jgi:23S rRNA (uracil1939-C5)-methyltransferase
MQGFAEGLRTAMPEILSIALLRHPVQSSKSHPVVPLADPKILVGSGALIYKTNSAEYRVSAGSFFQVNRHLTDELVDLVVDARSGTTALDLYAGVGLFSVVLARNFERVIAVESSQTSHSDLQYNRPGNVKAVHATTEHYLKNGGKIRADLVVVDPPRSGLGEDIARTLAELRAPRITYVSCDPATLARDLRVLVGSGYRIGQTHLIDLFPQTYHLETVIHLTL